MNNMVKWAIFLILGMAFNVISLSILGEFIPPNQLIIIGIILGIGELLCGITFYFAGKVET